MRSRFRNGPPRVFAVALTVHQLDSIPPIHQQLFVQWRARRATPPDGRTPSQPVEPGNLIRWNCHATFTLPIPSDPNDHTILQSAPLHLHLRSDRRQRWVGHSNTFEGDVTVDLAEVAAVGFLSRNHLVQGSLLNTTLKLSIRVTIKSGDKIFRTRTLPHVTPAWLKSSTPTTPAPTPPSASTTNSDPSLLPLTPEEAEKRSNTDRSVDHDDSSDRFNSFIPPPPTRLPSSNSMSSFPSFSAPGPASFHPRHPQNSSSALFVQTPSAVLESSIPNPELLQKQVYESIFQQRMRDSWPQHIAESRVDALATVNSIYSTVCQADGIGVTSAPDSASDTQRAKLDQTLCLDHLIESRADPVPSVPPRLPARRLSSRTLSVRSSSTSELRELAN